MGLDMPKHKWKMLLDEIDDDKSGELDYEELLDAVKRFNQGGWDAVRRLDPDRVELTPEGQHDQIAPFLTLLVSRKDCPGREVSSDSTGCMLLKK